MAHNTATMAGVEDPTKTLCSLVSRVDSRRDVAHHDGLLTLPSLNCKMLDINVSGARGRLVLINHRDGSLVIFEQTSWIQLRKAKFLEDRSQIFATLAAWTAAMNSASVDEVLTVA